MITFIGSLDPTNSDLIDGFWFKDALSLTPSVIHVVIKFMFNY